MSFNLSLYSVNRKYILLITYCFLPCLLPIALCFLLFAYCFLPIANCLLPIACCLLPIAYCQLLIAHSPFPIPHCPLPIAHCLLLMLELPIRWDRFIICFFGIFLLEFLFFGICIIFRGPTFISFKV